MPGTRSLRARTPAKRSSPVPADVQRVTQLAGEGALPLGATAGEPELLDEESGQAGGVIEREAVLVRNVGIGHKGELSLIHISEPTRLGMISYAVFCLKK